MSDYRMDVGRLGRFTWYVRLEVPFAVSSGRSEELPVPGRGVSVELGPFFSKWGAVRAGRRWVRRNRPVSWSEVSGG